MNNRMSLRLWFTAAQRRKLELFIYMVLLVIGCIAGTFCVIKYEDISLCSFCITYGMPDIAADGVEVFLFSFLRNCTLWLLTMFFGFCLIGQPCLLGVLTIHGFAAGCCLAKLSKDFTASILPRYIAEAAYTIAVSFILLLAVREAVRLSIVSLSMYASETDTFEMRKRLSLYFIRFGVLLFMILASSGIYAVFCGFFNA